MNKSNFAGCVFAAAILAGTAIYIAQIYMATDRYNLHGSGEGMFKIDQREGHVWQYSSHTRSFLKVSTIGHGESRPSTE